MSEFSAIFEQKKQDFIEGWKAFLRFASVSTDPANEKDCRDCADWLTRQFSEMGFKASLLETDSKPVVYAERQGATGAPTVLFYGHYDVQPVDPLEGWDTQPFEPTLKGDRLFARGAQDNKGQVWYVLSALRTLIAAHKLQATVKVVIEGEEECGSEGINGRLESWKDKLKADVLLVCDTGSPVPSVAAITAGLRGVISAEFKLKAAAYDLHSGVHGGVAPNPALEMARIVAALHAADGSIAIPGYYESVAKVSEEDLELARAYPLPWEHYKKLTGVAPEGGEKNIEPLVRRSFRPTIEVNGLHSGYGGPGGKTIIPSEASVKISARIVNGQNPKRCLELLIDHFTKHTPEYLTLEVVYSKGEGPALFLSSKSAWIQKAKAALESFTECGFVWEGASVPVVSRLAQVAQADPVLVGFGLEEDRIHAPNESFSIEQFRKGFLFATAFLSSL